MLMRIDFLIVEGAKAPWPARRAAGPAAAAAAAMSFRNARRLGMTRSYTTDRAEIGSEECEARGARGDQNEKNAVTTALPLVSWKRGRSSYFVLLTPVALSNHIPR